MKTQRCYDTLTKYLIRSEKVDFTLLFNHNSNNHAFPVICLYSHTETATEIYCDFGTYLSYRPAAQN